MRKSAQQAVVDALEGIREELTRLTQEVSGLRVALVEREGDVDRRFTKLEDEAARVNRNVVVLQRRAVGGVG